MEILLIFQTVIALLLTLTIILQAKGTSLGRGFGGTSYHAKRGMEKSLFYATIFLACLFVGMAAIIAF